MMKVSFQKENHNPFPDVPNMSTLIVRKKDNTFHFSVSHHYNTHIYSQQDLEQLKNLFVEKKIPDIHDQFLNQRNIS